MWLHICISIHFLGTKDIYKTQNNHYKLKD